MAGSFDERGKFVGPVLMVAADEAIFAVGDAAEHPVAVELWLVQPSVALGRVFGERGELSLIVARHGLVLCAWDARETVAQFRSGRIGGAAVFLWRRGVAHTGFRGSLYGRHAVALPLASAGSDLLHRALRASAIGQFFKDVAFGHRPRHFVALFK